jgi:predicted outer membrane protein
LRLVSFSGESSFKALGPRARVQAIDGPGRMRPGPDISTQVQEPGMKMTIGARTLAVAAALAAAPPAAAQTVTPQENDRTVHAFMSAVDLGEVQTSTLAQERAANAEVKAFATAMVTEHGAALHARETHVAGEGTGLFAGQMNHAPPAGPAGSDAHTGHGAAAPAFTAAQVQGMQTALEQHPASRNLATAGARNFQVLQGVTGPQFDATYMDAQIAGHRYALGALDRMIAQGGVTDEMLAMMRATRASVAQHLEQAQLIRGRLQ